ncbi:MAG: peptide ABC transporter substrate-binding protein [Patescibacteria group bacterium]|nr:peptide ABC transporter substrate-binding protein [Patescibacteria group bacterium]
MELKKKIGDLKRGFGKTKEGLQNADLDDVNRAYRKILKKIPDISHLKNIVLFSGVATLLIFILFAQRFTDLYNYLPTEPVAGGTYYGGLVGEINQLNPLFSPTNSAETSAVTLMFSGLTKHVDGRRVEGDLAERWEVSKDEKTYTFYLRDNLTWHDGERLTANDVAFTFNTIQNPDVGTPRLSTWKDIKVTAADERTVTFELPNPYASFIYLTDVPIVPEHMLIAVPAENMRAAEFSKNPIGSGPFAFTELREIKDTQEVHMIRNEEYYGKEAYLSEVVLIAYPNYADLTNAYSRKDVDGIERILPSELSRTDRLPNLNVYNLSIPEYDVLFMNVVSEALTDINLRKAITAAIDKEELIDEIYYGQAVKTNSAILPGFLGYNPKAKQDYNLATAQKILKDNKYVLNKEGTLLKDNKPITLRLVATNDSTKSREADTIAGMLGELGLEISVEKYPFNVFIEDYVRTRNYDLLLISENLGADSDIYTLYHSSMAEDPGLNFSGIGSRQVDKYLEEARLTSNEKERNTKYQEVSKFINELYPAVYLCRPKYLYAVSKEVKGMKSMKLIEPKDRFTDIASWYVKEKQTP